MTDNEKSVLVAAVAVADAWCLWGLRRDAVANAAGVSAGTVSGAFGGMEGLIDAVVEYAIKNKNHRIVAEAVVMGHKRALLLSREEKRKALMSLL